ncbi:MAG: transporter substrate-binding domain-containing protein [Syntrophobacteraceae bacterium]
MRRGKVSLIALGIALLSLMLVGAKVFAQTAARSVVDQVRSRGILRVGVSPFMPRVMVDQSGKLIGFDVDVANKVAEDLGVKVEIVQTAWDGIIPSLLVGKFDVIISGMIITPARNLTVNFTAPYLTDGAGLAVDKKLAAGFTRIEDFNKPGVKLTVRRGATPYIDLIRKLFPEATMIELDDDDSALKEVLAGKAHAVVSGEPRPTFWCMDHPDALVHPFDTPLSLNLRAFALRKGDADSLNFFNNWILVRIQDGWIQERRDYWFKGRQWADLVPKQ